MRRPKTMRVVSAIVQFCLFFLVFLGVTLWDPFHLKWFVTHPTPTSTRFFVPDGLLLAVGLYVFILLIEALLKRVRTLGIWTTGAFALAVALGFLAKIGFATHDLF